jgi:nucleotide-binding universal stress UspA family protein
VLKKITINTINIMNYILVGIDFEEGSYNALEHAISIAQKAKLDICCIWVSSTKERDSKIREKLKDEAKAKLEKLIKDYEGRLEGNEIRYKIREGKIYKEIIAEAKENKPYMMVIGTHGASGFEEFWIGSNANKIVTAAPCPVFTIRTGRTIKRDLKTIVMPLDSSLETRQKAPITGVMAKNFGAVVHILKTYTTHVKSVRRRVDGYADQVMKYFDDNEIEYKEVPLDVDNLSHDIIDYATSVDANLIVIMTEQETRTSNLWLGPFAHQMVNHSPIPVLSLHTKEILMSGSR